MVNLNLLAVGGPMSKSEKIFDLLVRALDPVPVRATEFPRCEDDDLEEVLGYICSSSLRGEATELIESRINLSLRSKLLGCLVSARSAECSVLAHAAKVSRLLEVIHDYHLWPEIDRILAEDH